jgi:glycosyltransferase involved in cell wall biosynthesis
MSRMSGSLSWTAPMKPRRLPPLSPTPTSRVAVGVPVRNGAVFLERALRAIVGQTHRNLEIVISDNASTDRTAEIGAAFAREDSRIRYIRQPVAIPADYNFRFAFEQCDSDWFMWASHDDLRDANYVETLLSGFASHPRAPLTFTDTDVYSSHTRWSDPVPSVTEVSPIDGVPFPERHALVVANGAAQFYGLFRTEILRTYRWPRIPHGHDWLILHWAAAFGDIAYVPGSTFQRYVPPVARRPEEERAYHWLQGKSRLDAIRSLPNLRWAIRASRELALARATHGLETNRLALIPMLSFLHHGGALAWAQQFVYWNAPSRYRDAWRAVKHRPSA